jgi:hypothetical protein
VGYRVFESDQQYLWQNNTTESNDVFAERTNRSTPNHGHCLLALSRRIVRKGIGASGPRGKVSAMLDVGVLGLFFKLAPPLTLPSILSICSIADEFYSLFYLGLYCESKCEDSKAANYMKAAAATEYATGPGTSDYMTSCARVHCRLRGW